MGNQWGQQPPSPQPQWGQQSTQPQAQWGQQPVPPQPQWGQQPSQPQWGQPPTYPPSSSSPQQPQWGQQPPPPPPPYPPQWGQQPPSQQQSGQQWSNTNWPQQTLYPGQFQPVTPQQPGQNKKRRPKTAFVVITSVVVVVLLACIISNLTSNSSNASSSTANQQANTSSTQVSRSTQPTTVPTQQPTPKPTPTQAPTATPVPTETQAQQEADYKNSTTSTTVSNLDKDGSADKGKDVHFICKIVGFIKNASGNTAGANVMEQDYSSSSVVLVGFTPNTDITQINQDDILEVWGTDGGVFSGTNGFGAAIQEVGIKVQYMTDQTTGYQANS